MALGITEDYKKIAKQGETLAATKNKATAPEIDYITFLNNQKKFLSTPKNVVLADSTAAKEGGTTMATNSAEDIKKLRTEYDQLVKDNPYSEQLKTYGANADSAQANINTLKGQLDGRVFTYDTTKIDDYQEDIDDLNTQLDNRKFSYDPASDPEYQYTLERYKTMGSQAAKETAASLASNTGGIANSYAASAAQAAYQDYLQEATGLATQYRDSARSQFDAETAALEGRHADYVKLYNIEDQKMLNARSRFDAETAALASELAKYENMYDIAETNRLSADANSKAYLNSLKSLYTFDGAGNVTGQAYIDDGNYTELDDKYLQLIYDYAVSDYDEAKSNMKQGDEDPLDTFIAKFDFSGADAATAYKLALDHKTDQAEAAQYDKKKFTLAAQNTYDSNSKDGYIANSTGGNGSWGGVDWDETVTIQFRGDETWEGTYKQLWDRIREENKEDWKADAKNKGITYEQKKKEEYDDFVDLFIKTMKHYK